MAARSTHNSYGTVGVIVHWFSALVILALLLSGLRADGIEDPATKAAILRVHVSLGLTILLTTLVRIAWWMFVDNKPVSMPMPRWQARVSRTVHLLFYVVIVGLAASGIAMMVLSGAGPIIFNGPIELLPEFGDYPPRIPHGIGARIMIGLIVLHAGAALHHHFFKRDGLLQRMWFGSR